MYINPKLIHNNINTIKIPLIEVYKRQVSCQSATGRDGYHYKASSSIKLLGVKVNIEAMVHNPAAPYTTIEYYIWCNVDKKTIHDVKVLEIELQNIDPLYLALDDVYGRKEHFAWHYKAPYTDGQYYVLLSGKYYSNNTVDVTGKITIIATEFELQTALVHLFGYWDDRYYNKVSKLL